jgi:hypothetical protein
MGVDEHPRRYFTDTLHHHTLYMLALTWGLKRTLILNHDSCHVDDHMVLGSGYTVRKKVSMRIFVTESANEKPVTHSLIFPDRSRYTKFPPDAIIDDSAEFKISTFRTIALLISSLQEQQRC